MALVHQKFSWIRDEHQAAYLLPEAAPLSRAFLETAAVVVGSVAGALKTLPPVLSPIAAFSFPVPFATGLPIAAAAVLGSAAGVLPIHASFAFRIQIGLAVRPALRLALWQRVECVVFVLPAVHLTFAALCQVLAIVLPALDGPSQASPQYVAAVPQTLPPCTSSPDSATWGLKSCLHVQSISWMSSVQERSYKHAQD